MARSNWEPGQVIRFTYNHTRIDEDTGDRHKEVLILNPNWWGKLHAIDLKRITAAEREVLQAIFDPQWQKKPHRLPLVRDILKRMNPVEDVKNPLSFYHKFVRIFLQNKDAYRQYFPSRMMNITIVKLSAVKGGVVNPKPLFHKVDSKDTKDKLGKEVEKQKDLSPEEKAKRLEILKKKAIKLFGQKGADITNVPSMKPKTATKAAPPTKAAQPQKATPAQGSQTQKQKDMKARLELIKQAAAKAKKK